VDARPKAGHERSGKSAPQLLYPPVGGVDPKRSLDASQRHDGNLTGRFQANDRRVASPPLLILLAKNRAGIGESI